MAELKLTNVTKRFGSIEVVHGINLHVRDGEFVVLVGPSGCGKSTALRMICGLEKLSSGDIEIDGKSMNRVPPAKRGVAMVFQTYALYPHMTVAENMGFSLRMDRASKAERRQQVLKVAEVLQLQDLLDRKPKELSGGQRQRVAIGRAIVRKPKVFLFDEPLSNLDAELRVQMRFELARLHREIDTTIVYVTHDQVEAMTLADRIVVMRDGYIEQIGTPMELYKHPVNEFVAGFIGSPRMNFLKAFVESRNGDTISLNIEAMKGHPLELEVKEKSIVKGTEVKVGIRPEHMTLRTSDDPYIDVEVEFIEQLGGSSFLYAPTCKAGPLIGRDDSEDLSVQTGEVLKFSINSSRIHLFDQEGDRLN